MFIPRRTALASTALCALVAAPAVAMTPQEGWDTVRAALEGATGVVETEAVTSEGEALVVTGIEITYGEPATTGDPSTAETMVVEMPQMRFAPHPRGIEVTLPPRSTARVLSGTGAEMGTLEARLDNPDLLLVERQARTGVAFSADGVTVETTDMQVDTSAPEAGSFSGRLEMTALAHAQVIEEQTRQMSSTDIATLDVSGTLDGPPSESGEFSMRVRDFATAASADLPAGVAATEQMNVQGLLASDLHLESRSRLAGFEMSFAQDPDAAPQPVRFSMAMEAMRADLEAADGVFETGSEYTGLEATFAGPDSPAPEMGGRLDRLATDLKVPYGPDAERDFDIRFDIEGLAPAESVWNIFDSRQILDRTPMDITLDIGGTLAQDFLAAPMDSVGGLMMGMAPSPVERFSLDEVLVSVLGARLTGNGAVSLAGMETVMDPTGAEGEFSFELTGFDAALRSLVSAGLLPQEQTTMIRAMSGMAFQPGPDGGLVSEITIADGAATVNGIPYPLNPNATPQ